ENTSTIKNNDKPTLNQTNTCESIPRNLNEKEQTEYQGHTGKIVWLAEATKTRPDLLSGAKVVTMKNKSADTNDILEVNKVNDLARNGSNIKIIIPTLKKPLKVLAVADGNFNTKKAMPSWAANLTYIIEANPCKINQDNHQVHKAVLVDYQAKQIKPPPKSPMSAEVTSVVASVMHGLHLNNYLIELGLTAPIDPNDTNPSYPLIESLTDSESLIKKSATTNQPADEMLTGGLYILGELTDSKHINTSFIHGTLNPADPLTKVLKCNDTRKILIQTLDTNEITFDSKNNSAKYFKNQYQAHYACLCGNSKLDEDISQNSTQEKLSDAVISISTYYAISYDHLSYCVNDNSNHTIL
ncbi:MAG: hypothetical protein HRT90_03185, partial [Candidatus Margulisbacteria bacterium]|nr:hypothetical protein [Candidatus Margulisiibacteriota bacterium]